MLLKFRLLPGGLNGVADFTDPAPLRTFWKENALRRRIIIHVYVHEERGKCMDGVYTFKGSHFLSPGRWVWHDLVVELLARKMASCSAKLFLGSPAMM